MLTIRSAFTQLTDEELERLHTPKHMATMLPVTAERLQLVFADRFPKTEFDGYQIPVTDMAGMIRCIHESICPTCGRPALRVNVSTAGWLLLIDSWMRDCKVIEIECSQGHKHTAEPNEIGTDWVAY